MNRKAKNGFKDNQSIKNGKSNSLIIHPYTGLPISKTENESSLISRRHFLTTAAAATAGAIWIKPLHVEAQDSWWRRLIDMATKFATGILFSQLGGGLGGVLGNLGIPGLNLLPQGNGIFGLKLPLTVPPGDSPLATVLQKLLAYAQNLRALKVAMGYSKKLLDKFGKYLPKEFQTLSINGPAIAALGLQNVLKDYLNKYAGKGNDFLSGLLLPILGGQLPYQGGVSLGSVATGVADQLIKNPPALPQRFEVAHLTESGTIIAQKHEVENVKLDRGEIDRGQSRTTIYIVPAKDTDNINYKKAHRNVTDWIKINSDYWSNEAKRKDFYKILFSNSVIQPLQSTFEFQREIG